MNAGAYARAEATLWRRVGDEVLVASPDGSEIERLSLPASAVWRLLERPLARDALTAALAAEFHSEIADIAGHVDRLVDELGARGWVVPAAADDD